MLQNYINVIAEFDSTGSIKPISFNWNGRNILIDKILDSRSAASLKHGGQGTRYTYEMVKIWNSCIICNCC